MKYFPHILPAGRPEPWRSKRGELVLPGAAGAASPVGRGPRDHRRWGWGARALQKLRSHWNASMRPRPRTPRPGVEMAVRRREETPVGGRLRGGAVCVGSSAACLEKWCPHTGRTSIRHVAQGAAITVPTSTDGGPAAPLPQDPALCLSGDFWVLFLNTFFY